MAAAYLQVIQQQETGKRYYTDTTRASWALKHCQVGADYLSSKRTFRYVHFQDLYKIPIFRNVYTYNFQLVSQGPLSLSSRILFLGYMLTCQPDHLLNFTTSSFRNNLHHIMQLLVNWTSKGQQRLVEVQLLGSNPGVLASQVNSLPSNAVAMKISSELQFATRQNLITDNAICLCACFSLCLEWPFHPLPHIPPLPVTSTSN